MLNFQTCWIENLSSAGIALGDYGKMICFLTFPSILQKNFLSCILIFYYLQLLALKSYSGYVCYILNSRTGLEILINRRPVNCYVTNPQYCEWDMLYFKPHLTAYSCSDNV